MTNARDKANIPVLNFQSKGIDDNADATAITIDSSERVGIGTSSPGFEFEVKDASGASVIRVNNGGDNKIVDLIADSTGGLLRTVGSYPLVFNTNQTERMRIDSSGSVGIGTSTPQTIFHILQTAETIDNGIKIVGSSSPVSGRIYMNSTDMHIDNATGGAGTGITLDTSGNVGIGLTSPGAKLDVATGSSNGAIFRYDTASTFLAIIPEDANGDVSLRFRANSGSAPDLLFKNDAGSEIIRFENSGKVGIGNTNASSFGSLATDLVIGTTSGEHGLTIVTGTGNSARMQFSDNTSSPFRGAIEYSHGSDDLMFYTNGSQKMKITSAGSVGIGTTSPSALLDLTGQFSDSVNTNLSLEMGDRWGFRVGTSSTAERLTLDRNLSGTPDVCMTWHKDDGSVSIGTTAKQPTSSGVAFYDSSSDRKILQCSHSSTGQKVLQEFYGNGTRGGYIYVSPSATTYATSSDYRIKENVNYDFDATSRLKQLKPARFNFIVDPDTTVDGFIAHEVSDIVPEAIAGEKDAVDENGKIEPQGIDQSKLVPLLVKTIQELEARITTLEANNP